MIKKPAGTLDFLPTDVNKRNFVLKNVRDIFSLFNYREIQTPSFEKTELFRRGIGEETDIVSKEMYVFNNDEFTLKPEMTAPVIRAYIENSMFNLPGMQKLYYISNMFRHERPQAGRYREFTQFGAEAIGSDSILIDVEMISLSIRILEKFGLKNVCTKINTIGTPEERKNYLVSLKNYLTDFFGSLSETSKIRLQKNPLRILDTKDEKEIKILENAPLLYDYLNDDSRKKFDKVTELLGKSGINYIVDHRLVRGFDYYTSTTFEVISDDLGSQNAILGGGRYDNLIQQLGGKTTPAIGFACGLERLMMVLEKNNFDFPDSDELDIYIVIADENSREYSFSFLDKLRKQGLKCDTNFTDKSVKSQIKEADKMGAKYIVVIGENEIKSGKVKLKKLSDGTENEKNIDDIITL
jgi:histidyl-tRNA synthetase